jgi:hypothetical protein
MRFRLEKACCGPINAREGLVRADNHFLWTLEALLTTLPENRDVLRWIQKARIE